MLRIDQMLTLDSFQKYRLPGGLAGLILHPAHEDSIFLIKEIKKGEKFWWERKINKNQVCITHPSLRANPNPNPAPTQTLNLTQGRIIGISWKPGLIQNI